LAGIDEAGVTIDRDGDVLRVRLSGDIDLADIDALNAALAPELQGRTSGLELDLSAVSFMDSTGVRWVLQLQQAVIGGGGDLEVVDVSEPVRQLFSIVGLLDHFGIAQEMPGD
jgi:anti-anti-sigma factor